MNNYNVVNEPWEKNDINNFLLTIENRFERAPSYESFSLNTWYNFKDKNNKNCSCALFDNGFGIIKRWNDGFCLYWKNNEILKYNDFKSNKTRIDNGITSNPSIKQKEQFEIARAEAILELERSFLFDKKNYNLLKHYFASKKVSPPDNTFWGIDERYWEEYITSNQDIIDFCLKKSLWDDKSYYTIVPYIDTNFNISTIQKLYNDKKRTKLFLKGSKVKGSFAPISHYGTDFMQITMACDSCYLCEGYATGISIFETIKDKYPNTAVLVCGSHGNLEPVLDELYCSNIWKHMRFIVAADNDYGEVNHGLISAKKLSAKYGIGYVYPQSLYKADFNDYYQIMGFQACLSCLEKVLFEEKKMQDKKIEINEKKSTAITMEHKQINSFLINKNLWVNELDGQVYWDDNVFDVYKEASLCCEAGRNGIDGTTKRFLQMVYEHAGNNSKHPLKNFIFNKKWDKYSRIHEFWSQLHFYGTESECEMYMEYCRRWIIGLVAHVYNPEAQNSVLILQGSQGQNKSRFGMLFNLIPGGFKEGSFHPAHKDDEITMTQKLVWMINEFDSFMGYYNASKIKDAFTRAYCTYRPPYGRANINKPCITSFLGSTNKKSFLSDETGNRRFRILPIKAISFCEVNIDFMQQLLAEAYDMYINGEQYWYTKEENENIDAKYNSEYHLHDSIDEFIHRVKHGDRIMNCTEILKTFDENKKWKTNELAKLKYLLEKNGFKYTTYRLENGLNKTGFKVNGYDLERSCH